MSDTATVLDSPTAIRHHLRHAIEPAGFVGNGVRFVLCDDSLNVLAHCHVSRVPVDVDEADCARTVKNMVIGVARSVPHGAILIALTRPGPPTLLPTDRRWYWAARKTCATHKVRLLGVHVVTPRGQRELVPDDAL